MYVFKYFFACFLKEFGVIVINPGDFGKGGGSCPPEGQKSPEKVLTLGKEVPAPGDPKIALKYAKKGCRWRKEGGGS